MGLHDKWSGGLAMKALYLNVRAPFPEAAAGLSGLPTIKRAAND